MVDISIVIVNYKSWNDLKDCLQSIITINSSKFTLETIVVDNQSNDGRLEEFKTLFPSILFIENSGNNGFANGCNFGASRAKGKYFFFLNPDTTITEAAIFEVWQTAAMHPDFGIVCCTQINESNKKYNEIRFFPSLTNLFGPFRAWYRWFNKRAIVKNYSPEKQIIFPDWATGAVIFMSRSWLERINGWTEKYWLYFEDVDICKKVNLMGGKVALIRNTFIIHKHGGASRINIKTKALTKTEVLISQHVYFNEHTEGFKNYCIQVLLVFTNLIEKTLLALIGIIFFFIPKLKVNVLILSRLIQYYINSIINRTWTSPRAMDYVYKQN
jgi:GT2 family glycosyltransferase